MPFSHPHCGLSVVFLFLLCLRLRSTLSFAVKKVGNLHQRPHLSRYHTFGPHNTVRTPCREATKDEVSEVKDQRVDLSTNKTLPKKRKTDNGVSKATLNGHLETKVAKDKRKKRRTPLVGPSYWRNEADVFLLQNQDLSNVIGLQDAHLIRFQVRGNPRPLRRHRTAKGFMYNPSSKYQESFRNVVEEIFSDKENPMFVEEHQLLGMKIIFYMKRPRNHFVSSKPGQGRLKAGAPPRLSPTRTDVDNLAKFVLDSLNGVLYVDDKQVASLSVLKIYDNDGHCEGCTEVSIVRLSEQHVDDLLQSGVQPFG